MDLDLFCCCGGGESGADDDESRTSGRFHSGRRRRRSRGRSRTPRTNVNASFDDRSFTSRGSSPFLNNWWSPSGDSANKKAGGSESIAFSWYARDDEGGTGSVTVTATSPMLNYSNTSSMKKELRPSSERQNRPISPQQRSTSRSYAGPSGRRAEERDDVQGQRDFPSLLPADVPSAPRPADLPRTPQRRLRASRQSRNRYTSGENPNAARPVIRTPSWGTLYRRMVRSKDTSVEGNLPSFSNFSRSGLADSCASRR